MADLLGLAAIFAKFALYLGILTASGTVFATLLFRLHRYRGLALVFGGLGVLATLLDFCLRGANLTGDASGMTDPEMLGLLWTTQVGTALALRLGGLGVLMVGLFMARGGLWLSAFGGAIAIWSFDHVGHVPDKDMWLLNLALMLHLLAVALWLGVLTPLRRLAKTSDRLDDAAQLGHRFGIVASFAVPVLIVAGGYMAYVLVGSLTALIGTPYGQALIVKVALVAVLLGLAAANKLRFIPDLKRGNQSAAQSLVRTISFEWGIVLLLLAVTALITSNMMPPT